MSLHRSSHPLVAHKLAILRDKTTEPKKFRELVRELTWLLGYEAMADLGTRPQPIETPLEAITAERLEPNVGLIPILRAGLGMVDAMLELLPTAEVWHIGLYRDERTLKPVEYYNKLPDAATVQVCLILDPMLATGGSSAATVDILKQWGAARIKQVSRHPRRGARLAPERARLYRAGAWRRRRPTVRDLRRAGLGAGPRT
jgi:uracil phosphoribosyltransferase